MMSLVINVNTIAEIATSKEVENQLFSRFLKIQDSDKVDEIMHRLSTEITAKIDCLTCGNCCKNLRPLASDKALEPFVKAEDFDKYRYLEGFKCKNIDCDNTCNVYNERPEECREYPYLHRDKFTSRTYELLRNYSVCPIVFNVFESLKKELKWSGFVVV